MVCRCLSSDPLMIAFWKEEIFMLSSCLILAVVLPMMTCSAAEAASKDLEESVSYAAYHSEWGDNLTPPIARRIHLSLIHISEPTIPY